MSDCQAKTKKGKSCKAPAMPGGLCFLHANPNKARELGRIGGRGNRKPTQGLPVTTTMTVAQVNEGLANTIQGVQSKRISARAGSALAQLYSVQLRAIQIAVEARLTRLEEFEAEQGSADASDGEPAVNPPNGNAPNEATDVPEANSKPLLTGVAKQALASPADAVLDRGEGSGVQSGNGAQDLTTEPHVSRPEGGNEHPAAEGDRGPEAGQRKKCAGVHGEAEAGASGKAAVAQRG